MDGGLFECLLYEQNTRRSGFDFFDTWRLSAMTNILKIKRLTACCKRCRTYIYSCQDRQWRFDATLRRVRVSIVAVKKQILHILSVPLQPYLLSMQRACCVLYCHCWPVRLYHIFSRYLINGTGKDY
jgi:hypothetical protein